MAFYIIHLVGFLAAGAVGLILLACAAVFLVGIGSVVRDVWKSIEEGEGDED